MLQHELGEFRIALDTKPKIAATARIQARNGSNQCWHGLGITDSSQCKTEGT